MKPVLAAITLACIIFSCASASAGEDQRIFLLAKDDAGSSGVDFAFMHLRSLVANYPLSPYREAALFSVAEYYFLRKDYHDAAKEFTQFLSNYPDSPAKIFSLAYLFAIAQRRNDEPLLMMLKKVIVTSQQLVFLFKDYKYYDYASALNRNHRAVYSINKLEFYVDDKLYAEIPY